MKKISLLLVTVLFLFTSCAIYDIPALNYLEEQQSNSKTVPKDDTIHKLGDTITISDSKGRELYTFTVDTVKTTTERNKNVTDKPEQVVVVHYTFKNLSSPNRIYIADSNFSVFDENENVAKMYPITEQVFPKDVFRGETSSGVEGFGLSTKSSTIKFYFEPNPFNNDNNTKFLFELPLE